MTSAVDIVQAAIDKAPRPPGLSFGPFRQGNSAADPGFDGLLRISYKGNSQTFAVVTKTHLHNAALDRLLADAAQDPSDMPLLIVASQVSQKHADRLMSRGVAFLDTAGNAFVGLPGLHLAATGKKLPVAVRKPKPGRVFQPSGLKLLFAFLTDRHLDSAPNDALLNRQFRCISQQTGVSLGSVGWILGDLQDGGYVVLDGKTRMLVDRKKMLQKWVSNYTDRLRPKQLFGRFDSPGTHWWHQLSLNVPDQLWGGEIAAAKLTGFLKPQVATIYTRLPATTLILDAGLRPNPDGDVELLQPFWRNGASVANGDCTHPLLVYADLLASDIDRNMDAAQRVYDEHLRDIIEAA